MYFGFLQTTDYTARNLQNVPDHIEAHEYELVHYGHVLDIKDFEGTQKQFSDVIKETFERIKGTVNLDSLSTVHDIKGSVFVLMEDKNHKNMQVYFCDTDNSYQQINVTEEVYTKFAPRISTRQTIEEEIALLTKMIPLYQTDDIKYPLQSRLDTL